MSYELVAAVLDHFPMGGSSKLAFVCLAERASQDGGNCWPSIAQVAHRMRCSESQARRSIHALIEAGYVTVEAEGFGTMARHYRIHVDRLTPSTHATPSTGATPSTHAHDPLHGCAAPLAPVRMTPCTHDTLTVLNHHRTTKEPPKAKNAKASVFPDWFPIEAWKGYVQMRREAKKPLTEPGKKLLITKLTKLKDAGEDPRSLLEQATEGNWSSVYPGKKSKAQAKDVHLAEIDYSIGLPRGKA